MNQKQTTTQRRQLRGVITSTKMNQTAVVAVTRLRKHPIYKKYHKVTTKYHAHNPDNQYQEDAKVIIEACRPMSKTKRWMIIANQ